MDFEFWKTASNVVLASGIALSALGTYGAYYFSNRLERERGKLEGRRTSDLDEARRTLDQKIALLVAGNDDLRARLTPFERLAKDKYPGLGQEQALERLRTDLTVVMKRAAELERKVQESNPVLQLIRTAAATVEIQVESKDDINTTFMDRGGYFALGVGSDALLVASGSQANAIQTGSGRVIWRGVWHTDASDKSVGKSVQSLRNADHGQIQFLTMPKGVRVLGGAVRLTINSAVQLDFVVPPQQLKDAVIMIPGVRGALEALNPEMKH